MAPPSPATIESQRPIWTRKADLCYVVFLSASIFFALSLDLIGMVPIQLPSWATAFHEFHKVNYNDPLYADDKGFFKTFILLEGIYLIPHGLWSIKCLINDDKMAAVHILALSTYLVSSTIACFGDLITLTNVPREQINKNAPGYVVFGIVAAVMGMDMFYRVQSYVIGKQKLN